MNNRLLGLWLASVVVLAVASPVRAGDGDAQINYHLGLAAAADGNIDEAYSLFKSACLAPVGVADACLKWAENAEQNANEKDIKRALASAVMLAPEDIRGRYALGVRLLKKEDYIWALEHLEAALPHAKASKDRALINYYLGFARFKSGEFAEASQHFSKARPAIADELGPKCDYYRALTAHELGEQSKAVGLMTAVAEGNDPQWALSAQAVLSSWSAFTVSPGWSAQVSGTFGLNTYPMSVFVDGLIESNPALESVFRGDLLYGAGNDTHRFHSSLTYYRQQYWTEIGAEDNAVATGEDQPVGGKFEMTDFNVTALIAQAGYAGRGWLGRTEHELKLGLESEVQYMENPPQQDSISGSFERVDDSSARMVTRTIGAKIWWSFARSPSSLYSLRLKAENRPNYIDRNMHTARFRLRFAHTRYLVQRRVQLKALLGARYDRSYYDPEVIKYDRFLPEVELNLRWRTPYPKLTVLLGGLVKYNWYLNSKYDADNSFRPQWNDTALRPSFDAATLAILRDEYYDYERIDWEWEASTALQLGVWQRGVLALGYTYHQRESNIDDAPTPAIPSPDGGLVRAESSAYSYIRHQVMLELKQRF